MLDLVVRWWIITEVDRWKITDYVGLSAWIIYAESSDLVIHCAEVEPVKHTPCELVRRQKAGQALEDEPPAEIVAQVGPVTWPGTRQIVLLWEKRTNIRRNSFDQSISTGSYPLIGWIWTDFRSLLSVDLLLLMRPYLYVQHLQTPLMRG